MLKLARLLFLLSLLLTQWCFGKTGLGSRIYNLSGFSYASPTNRFVTLNSILNTYPPDLFMVCKIETQHDGLDILNEPLPYSTSDFAVASSLLNTSEVILMPQLVGYDTNNLAMKDPDNSSRYWKNNFQISSTLSINDQLNLQFTANHKSKKDSIYNTLGQEMTSFDVFEIKYSLDVSTFANRLYFLVLDEIPNLQRFYLYH